MRTIELDNLTVSAHRKIMTVEDTCMYLNIMYPCEVNEFLESYDNWGDNEFIVEMTYELNLPLVMVRETTCKGIFIRGYINKEVLA